jgi:Mg2+ and Co2+ transporter CorA
MSEEIKFYSIGRGSLNIDGKFYYGLDYVITDFMRKLEQENQQLKEDYSKILETSKAYKKLLKTTMKKEHQAIKVLDEIRDYINKKTWYPTTGDEVCYEKILELTDKDLDDLLKILDKVKE